MFKIPATTVSAVSYVFMEGTPALDVVGENVGTVSEHGLQDKFVAMVTFDERRREVEHRPGTIYVCKRRADTVTLVRPHWNHV